MAGTAAGSSAGGDQGHREEQLGTHQPAGAVEMEDLSNAQPQPANPNDPPPASPSLAPQQQQQQHSNDSPRLNVEIPSPALRSHLQESSIDSGRGPGTRAEVGTREDGAAEEKEDDQPPSSPSGKAQGKAPATGEDLTIDPAPPTEAEASGSADAADISVEIMLLLTTGARHPFRIDEKYLHKRNVTVTGKTDDGKTDPSSITVYTLKELILRDWRKEWDQPPREPSAIRLIHFGRMLEDKMPLNHYQFSNTSRNVVHMTVKPQDAIDDEETAKKGRESSHQGGRSGCCVIL